MSETTPPPASESFPELLLEKVRGEAADDVREQLASLLFRGFVTELGSARLADLPRDLAAAAGEVVVESPRLRLVIGEDASRPERIARVRPLVEKYGRYDCNTQSAREAPDANADKGEVRRLRE